MGTSVERPLEPAENNVLRDPETRLLAAGAWSVILSVEAARCKRYDRRATVVMVEVSGLEDLETVWGADVAATAAARVGSVLLAKARSSDYAARIGARRFAILLPETDEIAAVNFVERVRGACDEALRPMESGARAWFGWADATPKRSLAAAAEAALQRVAADRRAADEVPIDDDAQGASSPEG
jgi:diguanylate cyclase (GGDEF)-like protein